MAYHAAQRQVDAMFVDEASVLDLPLASALLEALLSHCQLVFVGHISLTSHREAR